MPTPALATREPTLHSPSPTLLTLCLSSSSLKNTQNANKGGVRCRWTAKGTIQGHPKHIHHMGYHHSYSHPLALVVEQGRRNNKNNEPSHSSRFIFTTISWPKVDESHIKSFMNTRDHCSQLFSPKNHHGWLHLGIEYTMHLARWTTLNPRNNLAQAQHKAPTRSSICATGFGFWSTQCALTGKLPPHQTVHKSKPCQQKQPTSKWFPRIARMSHRIVHQSRHLAK